MSTIGVDFKIKSIEIDGVKVTLQMWDSSGQERYDSIIRPYFRNASAFVLVFDITNENTYSGIERYLYI